MNIKNVLFSLDVPSRRQLNTTTVNKRGSEKKKKTYTYFVYIYIFKKNTRVFSSDASNKYGAHHFGLSEVPKKSPWIPQTSSRILPRSTQVTVEDPGMDAAKSSIKENKTTVKSNQFLRDQCCDWVGWVGWGIFVSLISC